MYVCIYAYKYICICVLCGAGRVKDLFSPDKAALCFTKCEH